MPFITTSNSDSILSFLKTNPCLLDISPSFIEQITLYQLLDVDSVKVFIDWVCSELKAFNDFKSKTNNLDPQLQVDSWLFFQAIKPCITSVKSFLSIYSFPKSYSALVRRYLSTFSHLHDLNKSESKSLKSLHDSALITLQIPCLKKSTSLLIELLDSLIIAYNFDPDFPSRPHVDTRYAFHVLSSCLFEHLSPLIKQLLLSFSPQELRASKLHPILDSDIYLLRTFHDSLSKQKFCNISFLSGDEPVSADINLYKTCLHLLPPSLLFTLFDSLSISRLSFNHFSISTPFYSLLFNSSPYDISSFTPSQLSKFNWFEQNPLSSFEPDFLSLSFTRDTFYSSLPQLSPSSSFSIIGGFVSNSSLSTPSAPSTLDPLVVFLDSNPSSKSKKRALSVHYYLQGWSIKDISYTLSVSNAFIYKWLKLYSSSGISCF